MTQLTATKFEIGTAAHKKATAKLNKQLTAARKIVNSLEFGTDEFESAMDRVRALTTAIDELTDFGMLTSIEGDVWSV
jgi:hypothetical protein